MEKKEKRFRLSIVRICLFVSIIIFILNISTKDKDYSENENRRLKKKPKITVSSILSGEYFSDFEAYYADQFILRDKLISIRTFGRKLTGNKEISSVYIGKGGNKFARNVIPKEKKVKNTVSAINKFAYRYKNINIRALVIPNAASIMDEYLPKNAPVRNQDKDIKKFYKELKNVATVDAYSVLKENNDKQIYYKTDHHFTTLGAYKIFIAKARELGIENPIKEYDKYIVSDSFQGTLAKKTGDYNYFDKIEVYVPKEKKISYIAEYEDENRKTPSMFEESKLNEKDQYQVFLGGNHPSVEIRTTSNTDKTLLMFKDSYANSFVPFLYPYYKKIIMIDPRYYYGNVDLVMELNEVTDVLFLYSADIILDDENLIEVLR